MDTRIKIERIQEYANFCKSKACRYSFSLFCSTTYGKEEMNLSNLNLDDMDLSNADFSNIDFTNTTFKRVTLDNVNFESAILENCDMTEAKYVSPEQLARANFTRIIVDKRDMHNLMVVSFAKQLQENKILKKNLLIKKLNYLNSKLIKKNVTVVQP